MTIEADRLSKIKDHCQQRLREIAEAKRLDEMDGRANLSRDDVRSEIATILNLVLGIGLVIALALAGCALDVDPTPPDAGLPTCESLGAAPDMNLLCNVRGYCVYEGQQCARGSGDGSASGSVSDVSAGSAASGGAP